MSTSVIPLPLALLMLMTSIDNTLSRSNRYVMLTNNTYTIVSKRSRNSQHCLLVHPLSLACTPTTVNTILIVSAFRLPPAILVLGVPKWRSQAFFECPCIHLVQSRRIHFCSQNLVVDLFSRVRPSRFPASRLGLSFCSVPHCGRLISSVLLSSYTHI